MEQILSSYSPHEREMRRYGRPSIGSGLVFPLGEEKLMIEPVAIPDHWPRICGIDFGFDHPTACVWAAWDREEDEYYIYDCYRQAKAPPAVHAQPRPVILPRQRRRRAGPAHSRHARRRTDQRAGQQRRRFTGPAGAAANRQHPPRPHRGPGVRAPGPGTAAAGADAAGHRGP